MAETDAWTIGRLLQWTSSYLKQHGADSPRLDAEVLLAHARSCERIQLYTAFEEDPGEEVRTEFRELVKRRAAGTPVAYLVGHREFYSLSFHVTADVLIPRPETEFVVLTALDRIKERQPWQRPIQIVDVGTGSGNIAVALAKHAPDCRIRALDISPAALEVARRNVAEHAVEQRVELLQGDLLESLPAEPQLDFVVSNPPYISEAEMRDVVDDSVKRHEPHQALVAGPTGVEVIQRLAPQAAERLRPGGWLIIEIGPALEEQVHQLLAADGRFTAISTIPDLARLPRVVQAQLKP